MLCHTIYNSNSNAAVQTTITIFDDLTWKCHYYEKEVKSCSILSSLPSHICNVHVVLKVIKKLSVAHVCIGNCDDKFEEIVEHRKGKFLSLSGETAATIDSHEIAFQDRTISNTIRHVECDIFVDTEDGQCKTCRNYRPILRAMYHRYKQTALAENVSSSRTNSKTYTLTKLKECQARLQVAEEQLAKAQQISDQYIEVDEEVHNDLLTIINENAADINKALPNNSFSQLFWKQQIDALLCSNLKQMRWHPLVIRWCLSIKLRSPSTYEAMCKSGLLKLPSQRTLGLRDYTHVIKPSSGFSDEVDEMLMKEGRINEIEEWQKHVVLIFDEMHIKEDLVFDKTTGELKGFIRLGNINDHLLNLESALSNDCAGQMPPLANSMLTFMVRGIFIDLHFPYAQFPCKNLTGDLLYPLVWEAVQRLESCGFKVLATICDGASSNRHFIHMHGNYKSSLVYKTVNPYSNDTNRDLYFMIDVPHLMKTARNCWSNPKRKLWVYYYIYIFLSCPMCNLKLEITVLL